MVLGTMLLVWFVAPSIVSAVGDVEVELPLVDCSAGQVIEAVAATVDQPYVILESALPLLDRPMGLPSAERMRVPGLLDWVAETADLSAWSDGELLVWSRRSELPATAAYLASCDPLTGYGASLCRRVDSAVAPGFVGPGTRRTDLNEAVRMCKRARR